MGKPIGASVSPALPGLDDSDQVALRVVDGGLRVSLDGGAPVTLNLHAAARAAVAIPWTISFPTRGAHTISFTVVKLSGKVQADIDAIAVVS